MFIRAILVRNEKKGHTSWAKNKQPQTICSQPSRLLILRRKENKSNTPKIYMKHMTIEHTQKVRPQPAQLKIFLQNILTNNKDIYYFQEKNVSLLRWQGNSL